MDNSAANQLPEADSLPDGFVESSVEPLIHRTAVLEIEEPSSDYKNTLLGLDRSNETDSLMVKDSMVNEQSSGDHIVERTEKPRTFPVALSEKEGFDGYENPLEVTSNECLDHRQDEPATSESDLNRSETSIGLSLYNEVTTGSSDGHQHIEGGCQGSKQSGGECLDLQTPNLKEGSPPESAACLKNRKLENSSEVKRKNVKRGLKSEKELLELTLKYQQVITERDAAIAVRDKLESLCRELQRQNKLLMDECKRVSTEGQNMRLDISTKFHDAIKDVSNKLEVQKDECLSQLKENDMLRNKLKHLTDQHALSEQQFTQKLKQKVLELQLADLKIQQHQEKYAQEQSQMQLYAEQVSQLLATEKNLRLQLAADGEKFQQFQDALLKSNEVFETFKQEMEKMAKSIKELKKENVFLKSKCEKTDVSLIEFVEEREFLKKQLEKVKNQKEKLESLCRSLQAERKQNSVGSDSSNSVSAGFSEEVS